VLLLSISPSQTRSTGKRHFVRHISLHRFAQSLQRKQGHVLCVTTLCGRSLFGRGGHPPVRMQAKQSHISHVFRIDMLRNPVTS
jgi:hypothetical protein